MLGLLTTTEGIPISHHVFPGNTRDSSTLPVVAEDLSKRFGVGRLCLVADRGIITADNLNTLSAAGIDYVLATRLHRDELCEQALAASVGPSTAWVPVPSASSFATEVAIDNTRCVVVASPERWRRDTARTKELVKRTEEKLVALEWRVRDGELVDPGKIGRAAQRILGASGVARLFSLEIGKGRFVYDYDHEAMDYEKDLLCGRYVLTTSLPASSTSTASVVTAYRGLLDVEDRFRELKDFLGLRPVRHFTESRYAGTSESACWRPRSRRSWHGTCAGPMSATRTFASNTSRPGAPLVSSTGSASSRSLPASAQSKSSPAGPPCKPRC